MICVKINETIYPATINGKMVDSEWDNRETKIITLKMDHATATTLFVDGISWSIVDRYEEPVYEQNEKDETIQVDTEIKETEWDNSMFYLAGDITDHRDGTITVKMGKLTDLEEAYGMLLGGAE